MEPIVARKGSRRRAFMPAALLATTMLTGAGAALAQTPAKPFSDELVVTAQKREENIQKVPLSIQAIGTAKLEQLQVSNVDSVIKFLPSVVSQPLSPGFTRVFMRGVTSGDNPNHSASLPSVGTYLDEQPITTILGALDVHFYDIARVESLSGPQGTLYGASSEAGTIRIITNKPKIGVFSGAYDISTDKVANGGWGYAGEGYVNIPINDKAAIRLVAWGEHDAGYIDNVPGSITFPTSGITVANTSAVKNDYNTVDTIGGRAALKIDLDENWTITPAIMAQQEYSNGVFGYDPRIGDLKVSHALPEYQHDRWVDASLTIEGKLSNLDLVYAGALMRRHIDSSQDYTDYSYFYDALFGYGAYSYDNNGAFVDPSQLVLGRDHYTKQSHEFRISTPKDARLRVVAGLFYQRQVHDIGQQYVIKNLADAIEVPGWPDTIWLTAQRRVDRDYALFGEAAFDFTDKLTLTAGGRVFKYDNSLVGFFGYGAGFSSHTGESQCFEPATVNGAPCNDLDKKVEQTGFTHKLNLTYRIDDDKLVYATWSRGFRPGGINRRGNAPYQSDFLANYELGWKTSWDNGRLRFNGALFWEDWSQFQFSFLGNNGLTEIHNAPHARILGAEADFSFHPDEHLTLSGSAAYTHGELTQPFCEQVDSSGLPVMNCSPPQAPSGTQLPVTPYFKGNATARYEHEVGPFDGHLQASVIYQGDSWADLRLNSFDPALVLKPARSALGQQKGYATVDLTAGIGKDNWTVELSLLNAFDERGDVYRYAECRVTVCAATTPNGVPGAVYVVPAKPRTIGVKFGQKF